MAERVVAVFVAYGFQERSLVLASVRSSAGLAPKVRTSFKLRRQTSIYPRQYLLQGRKEPLPPALGALVGLLLIRSEARLLQAQVGPRDRWGESLDDDHLVLVGRPGG